MYKGLKGQFSADLSNGEVMMSDFDAHDRTPQNVLKNEKKMMSVLDTKNDWSTHRITTQDDTKLQDMHTSGKQHHEAVPMLHLDKFDVQSTFLQLIAIIQKSEIFGLILRMSYILSGESVVEGTECIHSTIRSLISGKFSFIWYIACIGVIEIIKSPILPNMTKRTHFFVISYLMQTDTTFCQYLTTTRQDVTNTQTTILLTQLATSKCVQQQKRCLSTPIKIQQPTIPNIHFSPIIKFEDG